VHRRMIKKSQGTDDPLKTPTHLGRGEEKGRTREKERLGKKKKDLRSFAVSWDGRALGGCETGNRGTPFHKDWGLLTMRHNSRRRR